MRKEELIQLLEQLPPNTTIEIYHQVYSGGGDDDTFDTPELYVSECLNIAYLTPARYRSSLEHGGKVYTVSEIVTP